MTTEETNKSVEERRDNLWWDLNRTLKEFRVQKTAYDDTIALVTALVEHTLLNELIEEVEKIEPRVLPMISTDATEYFVFGYEEARGTMARLLKSKLNK